MRKYKIIKCKIININRWIIILSRNRWFLSIVEDLLSSLKEELVEFDFDFEFELIVSLIVSGLLDISIIIKFNRFIFNNRVSIISYSSIKENY